MRRLLHRETAPPQDAEGWSFRFTHENGHTSKAGDYWTWREKILAHRNQMNLPIPANLMETAEDQLCGTLPAHLCQYQDSDAPSVDVRITFDQVKSWLKAVTSHFISGTEHVEQLEAERRADICVTCPLNVNVVGGCGGGCQKLVELLTPGMYARSTKQDTRLRSCAVCSCYLKVLTHFPLTALQDHDNADMQAKFPAFCWQKVGGDNYIP